MKLTLFLDLSRETKSRRRRHGLSITVLMGVIAGLLANLLTSLFW